MSKDTDFLDSKMRGAFVAGKNKGRFRNKFSDLVSVINANYFDAENLPFESVRQFFEVGKIQILSGEGGSSLELVTFNMSGYDYAMFARNVSPKPFVVSSHFHSDLIEVIQPLSGRLVELSSQVEIAENVVYPALVAHGFTVAPGVSWLTGFISV